MSQTSLVKRISENVPSVPDIQIDPPIAELDRAVLEEAQRRDDAVLLMTDPGIGPVTAPMAGRLFGAKRGDAVFSAEVLQSPSLFNLQLSTVTSR